MQIKLWVSEGPDDTLDLQAECGANWLSLNTEDPQVVIDHMQNFIERNLCS